MPENSAITILIVDDVESSRYTLGRMLQKARFAVKEAANGNDALRLAAEKPDLVILDVNLPDMSGYDVCKRIKSDAQTSSIPVLHLSASFVDSDNRSIGLESGADGYLTYPVEPRELLATIEALLRARRAEQEVREQRELLQVTLNSIGDAVITTDAKGLVTFMNPVAVALTGWTVAESAGRPIEEIFQIRDKRTGQPAIIPVERVIREGTVVGLANHTTLTSRDGTVRLIDDSASPIRDRSGNVVGVVMVFRDVTEQHRIEEARRQSEEHLHLMLESVTDYAFFSTDADGMVTSWNKGAQRVFGYKNEDIIGRSIDLIFTPEDVAAGVPDRERAVAKQEGRAGDERWHCRQDGSRFFATGVMTPLTDEYGAVIGFTKVARDFTERRRTEENIARLLAAEQHNTERLREVASASLNVNATLSTDSILRVLATEARRIIGAHGCIASLTLDEDFRQEIKAVSLSETHDGPPHATIKPDASGLVQEVCRTNRAQRTPASGARSQSTDELLRAQPSMLGWLAAPFTWSNGSNKGLIQLFAKIGGDFSADDEAVLMQLASGASVAMENAHLYNEIRQVDQRKSEFLAILAHELRNPLAPVRNVLKILEETGDDSRTFAKFRGMMERQVAQMSRLVDDLLDLSRISRGKIELQLQPLELKEVVNNALESSRVYIEAAQHTLTVALPPDPIYVNADMTRLSQVIMNLLNNAAKYTDRGGSIWLTGSIEKNMAVIRVKDTGIGIPRPMLRQIFEMFAQVDSVAERSQGGLGIGLTLVRTLMKLHAGSIEARSEGIGKGSEFIVRLPRLASMDVKLDALQREPEPAKRAMVSLRILVVDDNRDAADSLATLLELSGNQVSIAHEGHSAVRVAHTFRPDVALLDIGLPGLNGYEVARQIRQNCPDAVLVAITGWGQNEDVLRSQEAGFNHHLVKPANFEILRGLIAEIAARR